MITDQSKPTDVINILEKFFQGLNKELFEETIKIFEEIQRDKVTLGKTYLHELKLLIDGM